MNDSSYEQISELERDLTRVISQNPSLASGFLTVISNALRAYEIKTEQKRNRLADSAIRGLLDPKVFRKWTIPYTIDAIQHQFPEGKPTFHSKMEVDCYNAFVERLLEDDEYELEAFRMWLSIKGDECYTWFYTKLYPFLEEKRKK